MTASVSVLYVCWLPAGVEAARQFVDSYKTYGGGMPHDFHVLYKSYQDEEALTPFRALFRDVPHHERLLPDAVLDIDAYLKTARLVTTPYVCNLNTASVVQDADWLRKLYDCACLPDVGVAGATGSWADRRWDGGGRDAYRLWRHYAKQRAAALWLNRMYAPFPNPHVRSNAFMISRERLLALKCPAIRSKHDAWNFEHGKNSMTRQLQKQKLRTLLVGRDGQRYDVQDWPRSGTYCSLDQDNLLVADNRTRLYAAASAQDRGLMRRAAWGEI